jgi:hypothetical protein
VTWLGNPWHLVVDVFTATRAPRGGRAARGRADG